MTSPHKYTLLDGRKAAADMKKEIITRVKRFVKQDRKRPHLAIIMVGDSGASNVYVNRKIEACKEIGFHYSLFRFADVMSEERLIKHIEQVNQDEDVDGFIVQLPLPSHMDVEKITECILPEKDVDGFTNQNFGGITSSCPPMLPATPLAVIELLRRYKIKIVGKHCVVVGASRLVGAPLSMMLAEQGHATVTLCHRHTKNLSFYTQLADVLIVAVGKPRLIDGTMIKEGAVVIDIGTTRVKNAVKIGGYSLKGDVDFESVAPKCSYITPVPGGVGPMTVAALLSNTLKAYEKHLS